MVQSSGMLARSLLIATLAAVIATPGAWAAPPSVVLWDGLRTGMSAAQVRRAFPAASPQPDPEADAGYLTTLQAAAPVIDRQPVRALFRFHNDRLFSVRLDVLSLRPGERTRNLALADRLIAGFSRAGPGYDCFDNSRADVKLLDCKWLREGVAIRLEYMDVSGQAPALKILLSPVSDVGSDL